MRAKLPSAPGGLPLPTGLGATQPLGAGLTQPLGAPPPAPAPFPSPPPPPLSGAPFEAPPAAPPAAPAAPPPMRAKQPSAPGFPVGLTPPPERPGAAPLAAAYGKMPFGAPPPTASSTGQPGAMGQLAPNPFAASSTADVVIPEPKKNTGLIVGIVIAVLAAGGVAIALGTSKSAPPPPPVPTVTVAPPVTDIPTTAPTPAREATPSQQQTGGDLPSGPRPGAAPAGGDFSQMFAAGAEKAKGGATGGSKAFDAEEARTALAGVLKSVAACKEPGGPQGQANAAITFSPSGQVTGVTIGAPFSGTSTGTCIIGAFKAAKVAPFSGLPGTVSQPVSLL